MNTHIIIPIKDIEEKIKLLSVELDKDKKELRKIEYSEDIDDFEKIEELEINITGLEVAIAVCSEFLQGKQIFLDKKDIEKKAEKYSKELIENKTIGNHEKTWIKSIYLQGLKDLL